MTYSSLVNYLTFFKILLRYFIAVINRGFIAMQFNLTCDEEWKQTFANTLYMIGMLVGALTLGNLSDA